MFGLTQRISALGRGSASFRATRYAAASGKPAARDKIVKGSNRFKISGFSKFSSRVDLLNAIDMPEIVIGSIEREVDSHTKLPLSSWVVELALNEESADMDTAATAYELVRMHLMVNFNRRFNITQIHANTRINTTADFGIDDCTVRIRSQALHVSVADVRYLVQDYKLAKGVVDGKTRVRTAAEKAAAIAAGDGTIIEEVEGDGNKKHLHSSSKALQHAAYPSIERFTTRSHQAKGPSLGMAHFFIRFASPAEAMRAYMNLEGLPLGGYKTQMVMYF